MVACLLEQKGLKFDPQGSLIRETIENCLRDALRATSSIKSFLQINEFDPFTSPLAELGDALQLDDSAQDMYSIVTQDPTFKQLMFKIGVRYDGLFDRVVTYCADYEMFVHIFKDNSALQDCKVHFADATLDTFREELAKYKKQLDDIKAMGKQKDIGLFRLDSKHMQEILLPSPMRCQKLLSEYIPSLTMEKGDVLFTELKTNNGHLDALPANVDEYVEFNVQLNKIDAAFPSLENRYLEIQELIQIIGEFSIRVDQDTKKAFGDLAAGWKTMVTSINAGKERVESDSATFIKSLEADIPELENRVKDQTAKLDLP